ncbi:MAG: class II glutamine amidotransferase [Vicinamibacteria bacterium]
MCRLLMLRGERGFNPGPLLTEFRDRCRKSSEFQGDGWGAAFRAKGEWARYRSLTPIWEDVVSFPREVDFLVVHARSAFRSEGIELSNNMPFYRGGRIFVFNGELRGVRLRAPGRIGAEKIFHVVLTQDQGDLAAALESMDRILRSRSRYVRAMNVALTDERKVYALCRFSETPDYFTLHYRVGDFTGVSSEPLDEGFLPMTNGEIRVL